MKLLYFITTILILGLFSSPINFVQGQLQLTAYNPDNQHYYQRYQYASGSQLTGYNATQFCESLFINNTRGYLVTWTSSEEWAWARANGIVTNVASWMSGSDDYTREGVWYYSSGPEKYQPLYNLYFDKCYTNCQFGPVEPNLIPNEHYLHTTSAGVNYFWNNNNNLAVILGIICEFGGMEEPIMPYISTSGGLMNVTNLDGYQQSSLTITFTKVNTSTSFTCGNIKSINSTAVSCQVPAQTGQYKVIVKDGTGKTSKPLNWQFESPFVSSVYPGYTQNSLLTITGTNFGTDTSKLTVNIGSGATPCNSVQFIVPNQAFTCVLSANLGTNKLLPISLTVDTLIVNAYKPSVYFSQNRMFYSGFISSSSFQTTMLNYSSQLRVDGQAGHAGVINSQALYKFLNDSLPIPFGSAVWNIWQGAKYVPSSNSYTYLAGPNQGSTVPGGIYSLEVPDKTGWTESTQLIYNLYNGTLFSFSSSGATLVEYGGEDPKFNANTTNYIGTEGGDVEMSMDNYGTQFSTITINYRGSTVPYYRDFIQSYLVANVPIGIDGPYEISVTIDGRTTPSKTQYIKYSAPIVSAVNSIPTTGNYITIQGSNFYNQLASVSLTSLQQCTSLSYVTTHTVMRCLMPAGSGTYTSSIKVGSQISNAFTVVYDPPVVTSVSQGLTPLGGDITIDGNNFFTDASLIQVKVGGVTCQNVKMITAHKTISCTMPSGQGTNKKVVVTVSSQDSNQDILFSYAVPIITSVKQIQDYIQIEGNNYGNNLSLLSVYIGSINVTSSCILASNVLIQCSNLDNSVVSGTVSITGPYSNPPTYPFTFTPYLKSISPIIVPTIGNKEITINGRYFEQSSNGVSNTISVIDNGVAISSLSKVKYDSNQRLIYTSQSGTGVSKTLGVSVGPRTSNILQYSYEPPTFNATQNGLSMSLSGTNFGSNIGLVTLNVGSINITQISFGSTPHASLDTTLPTNVQNGEISLSVDGQLVSNLFKFQPTILSIQNPSVLGGLYNLTGYLLSTVNQNGQSTNPTLKINGTNVQCSVVQDQITNPYTYQCQLPAGSGVVQAVMTVDGQPSPSFTLSYQPPTVVSASSTYYQTPGLVTIQGTNFANTNLLVNIEGVNCPINRFINDTHIVVSYDSSVLPNGALSVSVTVNGLNAKANVFTYYGLSISSAEQSGDSIEIHGSLFGDVSKLTISIGNASSVSGCTGNDTYISCTNLPNSASSGYIVIKNGPLLDRLMFFFRPILLSITPLEIPTSGDQISLQGRFFENFNPDTLSMEPLLVIIDGNAMNASSLVDSQNLVINVGAGFGVNHSIQVSSQSLLSDTILSFSYIGPVINNVQQDQSTYNRLTITGKDFSDDIQVVQATLGGEPLTVVSVSHTQIIVTAPDSSRNGLVQVQVSTAKSNTVQFYLTPILLNTAVSTKPLTSGGKVTITGYFLSTTDSLDQPLALEFQHNVSNVPLSFTSLSSSNSPYSLEVIIPIGYDSISLFATYPSNSISSNNITIQYQEPIVQSATPVQKGVGGNVTIYGQSFGDGDMLDVLIDVAPCTNPVLLDAAAVLNQMIICQFDGSVDKPLNETLEVTVKAHHLTGSKLAFLYLREIPCPNNCSMHGVCQVLTGECVCEQGYKSSVDCSTKDEDVKPPVTPPIVDPNANTTFPAKVNFSIAISHLREIDIVDGSVVKTLSTSDLVWNVSTISDTQKLYTGQFPTDPALVLVTITNFKEAGSVVFAGETIPVQPNSVKYEVTISNWDWVKLLSSLEIIYNTKTDKSSTFNCEEKSTTVSSAHDNESLYSFQLDTGSSVLDARFSTRMIVDNKITPSRVHILDSSDELYGKVNNTEHEYNLLVAMVSPYFSTSAVLDPTFSSLLKSETKTECGKTSTWKIPVIVVCSVVGAALLVTSAFLIQRKLREKSLNTIKMSRRR